MHLETDRRATGDEAPGGPIDGTNRHRSRWVARGYTAKSGDEMSASAKDKRSGGATRSRPAKAAPGPKKTTAKKTTAKKTTANKKPAKKTTAKKTTANKKPAKKTAAKKTTAKKTAAKKKPAKKKPAKKTPAKKTTAKKNPASKTRSAAGGGVESTEDASPARVRLVRPEHKVPKGSVICSLSGLVVRPQKPNIKPKKLDQLEELLESELARHLRHAEDLRADAEALVTDREQGDTQFDEESGEGDTVSVERERDLLLSASARHTVEEIRAGLARIKAGTYGLCEPAGRRITLARLEAIPWADQCVDCKAARERRR